MSFLADLPSKLPEGWASKALEAAGDALGKHVPQPELNAAGREWLAEVAPVTEQIERLGAGVLTQLVGFASAVGTDREALERWRVDYEASLSGATFADALAAMDEAGARHEAGHAEIERQEAQRTQDLADVLEAIAGGAWAGLRVAAPYLLMAAMAAL